MKILKTLGLILVACFSNGFAKVMNTPAVKKMFVYADKAGLFCKIVGKGDPILILHGGPGLSLDYLFPQMSKLGKNHLAIFYDQRACGRSTGKINSSTIQLNNFLEDIESIRKAFGFKKMTILGHSWGGFLAMKYAITHPDAVDKLILMDTMPASSDELSLYMEERELCMAPYLEELHKLEESQDFLDKKPAAMQEYYHILLKAYCYNLDKTLPLDFCMTTKTETHGDKVTAILSKNLFSTSFDMYDELKQLKAPTLIIHGDADPIPHAMAQRIHECIPNSKYILLKNCGHFPFIETPDVLFQHLDDFLTPTKEASSKDDV